jgi:hypothetical protein
MFVHLPEFNGDTVFKVFTRSDIVILGPPKEMKLFHLTLHRKGSC